MHAKRSVLTSLGLSLLLLAGCDSPPESLSKSQSGALTVAGAPAPVGMPAPGMPAPKAAMLGGSPHGAPPPPESNIFTPSARNSWMAAAEQPVSTVSLDVSKASYAMVRRLLREGRTPPAGAVRADEFINYFPYSWPAPAAQDKPFRITTTVLPSPWHKNARLLHVALKGWDQPPTASRPPVNLTFLLDVSGSMSPQDRLPLIQKTLHQLADGIRPDDTVSVVTYANGVTLALPPVSGRELGRFTEVVESLHAEGGTAGGEGLKTAYAQAATHYNPAAVNRVVLATDGDFNLGETDPGKLEEFITQQRDKGIYLTVLGVGLGNLNDALMQRLAHAGRGQAAYLDSIQEGRKVFVEELSSLMQPIANDAKLQIEFNPAQVGSYRLVGYDTRQLRREEFKDEHVAGGQIGAGHSLTLIYEFVPASAPDQPVEPLRYKKAEKPVKGGSAAGEMAYVRLRYARPGKKNDVQMLTQAVPTRQTLVSLQEASPDLRFSVAMAGFAQLLRGEMKDSSWSWQDAATLADQGRGTDPDGWRAEAVQLIRAGQTVVGR